MTHPTKRSAKSTARFRGPRAGPASPAGAAPDRLVDLGARAGHRGQPHDQPAAAGAGAGRARLRGRQPAQRRAVGPGVQVLPRPGARRHRASGSCSARSSPARRGPHDHVLFTLPRVHMPALVRRRPARRPGLAGGDAARRAFDGLRLGTLLCCIGAANVLANPKRALRVLPGALYELGVAVVVALSVAPQLVESVQRVRRARRLRAGHGKGLRALRVDRDPGARGRARPLAAARRRRWTRAGTAGPARRPAPGAGAPRRCCWPAWSGCASARTGCSTRPRRGWLGLPALVAGAALCVRRPARRRAAGAAHRLPARPVAGAGVGRRRRRGGVRGRC